jgi:hypothetical protein
MKTNRMKFVALFAAALMSLGVAGPALAAAPRADVVGEADLLRRPDVRRIAGAAGIDIARVSAAAGLLSGAELAAVAQSANEVNTQAGGAETVTLAVTTIIIILLLIIILAN